MLSQRIRDIAANFERKEQPDWVKRFHGPFADGSSSTACVVEQLLASDQKTSIFQWARKHMKDHLDNIVVPVLCYDDEGHQTIRYCVLLGDPNDVERIAKENPTKDGSVFFFKSHGIATEPDEDRWRKQRVHLASSFIPGRCIAPAMSVIQNGVDKLLDRWGRLRIVDAHQELHHFALDMFLQAMFGVSDLLPPTPEESEELREAFNLDVVKPSDLIRTHPKRVEFINRVLEYGTDSSSLLNAINDLDEEDRFSNVLNFIVAGHDTTAHTLEWILVELARHPKVQEAMQAEADKIFQGLREERRSLAYKDLSRLQEITRVITETLRLWGPASLVFRRVLTSEQVLRGRDGPVSVPANTPVNFWYYGQHHSKQLWGGDANSFCPLDRQFSDEELQRNSARTPASQRYHPFSLPGRDCLGKNFSLLEMRLLLLCLVRRFRIELCESDVDKVADLSCGMGETFQKLLERSGPIKPPRGLHFHLVPRMPSARL